MTIPHRATWNDIVDFLARMFPDDIGPWTVREIVCAAERAYDDDDDLKVSKDRVYAAIDRLLAHQAEHTATAHKIERHFTGDRYYYTSRSARMILKEAINGVLPKKFQPTRHTQTIDKQARP